MKRALILLAALLAGGLAAPSAYAQAPDAATRLVVQPSPAGGSPDPAIDIRLSTADGRPVADARVLVLVDGQRLGEARTDSAGRGRRRIDRPLAAGQHRVEVVFEGRPGLLPTRAHLALPIRATTLELSTSPAAPQLGQAITLQLRVTDDAGAPVPQARVAFAIDGVPYSELRTGADGLAARRIEGGLAAGRYTIAAAFVGQPGQLPAQAAQPLVIAPAMFEVQTVPALAGVRFELNGQAFVSGEDGMARVPVAQAGAYRLRVLPWDNDASGVRAQFDRWEDPVFAAERTVQIPKRLRLKAGFDVSYLIRPVFVDPAGRPVDPARIAILRLTSSYGAHYEFDTALPRWLKGIHVVRLRQGLSASKVSYAVEDVLVDGANVVNQAQQRFEAVPGAQWRVQLQIHTAQFVVRDALFGFPIGSALSLTYPDGQMHSHALGRDAGLTFSGLARGAYTVQVTAPGISGITPAALSRDQEVRLLVLSYLDLAVIGGLLAVIALALLTIGRPWLPAALRDPRRLLGAVWPQPAPLRAVFGRVRDRLVGRLRPGRLPAARDHRPARPRIQRSDPALVFALLLIGLGLLGGSLARSAAAVAPAATPRPAAATPVAATPAAAAPTARPPAAPATVPPATPAQALLTFERNLAAKSSGPDVVRLQQRLRELGYFNYPENTGLFGALTAQAVSQFQRAQGLRATGVVDRATVVALNRCGGACAAGRPESGNK